MKWIKQLDLNEGYDDATAKKDLEQLGLIEKAPFHDRFDAAMGEWYSDPEVSKAFDTLRDKGSALIQKWDLKDDEPVDFSQPMANWESYLDKMSDEPFSNIGLFDYLALVEEI